VDVHEQWHDFSLNQDSNGFRCVTMSLMPGRAVENDRDTRGDDRLPTARPAIGRAAGAAGVVGSALQQLRLEGAIFLRAEYREPWAYESLPGAATAQILRPGTDRVVLFHVVAAGTCWVATAGGERHWANAGDVIVLPYADQHRMGGVADAVSVPLTTIMAPPPWTQMPIIRHGAPDGPRTDIVCGFLHSTDILFDPRLRAFPPVFIVRPPPGPLAEWVRATVAFALQQAEIAPLGPDAVTTRLPELLLTEVLRIHLASTPAIDSGWIAALHDPLLNPALAALHADPARRWTVPELARMVATSRSALDGRFREVLGLSPIRYLTEWRLHLARDLLAMTDLPVAAIARRVGYEAEEAFSRAFKRAYGRSPALWRADHRLRA
jgi:AraC-like DNA-binding protein